MKYGWNSLTENTEKKIELSLCRDLIVSTKLYDKTIFTTNHLLIKELISKQFLLI